MANSCFQTRGNELRASNRIVVTSGPISAIVYPVTGAGPVEFHSLDFAIRNRRERAGVNWWPPSLLYSLLF
jgi:hypothetical protein